MKKVMREEHSDCGTHPECMGCALNVFMQYITLCSELYGRLEGHESELRRAAQLFIDKCYLDDLGVIGDAWNRIKKDFRMLPIKKRAGMRRGFDLLTVESLSRY